MKDEFNFLKELVIVGIVFVAICFSISAFQHDLEFKRVYKLLENEKQSKVEIIKLSLERISLDKEYISILQQSRESLNEEIDLLTDDLKQYKALEKLKKDLDRSRQ